MIAIPHAVETERVEELPALEQRRPWQVLVRGDAESKSVGHSDGDGITSWAPCNMTDISGASRASRRIRSEGEHVRSERRSAESCWRSYRRPPQPHRVPVGAPGQSAWSRAVRGGHPGGRTHGTCSSGA